MKEFEPYKRPTTSEKIVATIRIDIETLEEIDNLASKVDVSRNELINQCIRYALDNLKDKNTKEEKEK